MLFALFVLVKNALGSHFQASLSFNKSESLDFQAVSSFVKAGMQSNNKGAQQIQSKNTSSLMKMNVKVL